MIAERFGCRLRRRCLLVGNVLGKSTRRQRLEPMPRLDLDGSGVQFHMRREECGSNSRRLVEMSVDRTKRSLGKPYGQNAAVIP
jgi:hypothetical protein